MTGPCAPTPVSKHDLLTGRRIFPLRPGEKLPAAMMLLGLAGAAAIAIGSGGYEFLFYIVVVALITVVVAIIHRRVELSHASLWALFVWAAVHMAGGMLPLPAPTGVLYNLWVIPGLLKYDQLVHAYGFGLTAWVAWQALRRVVRPGFERSIGVLAAAALAAAGLGAVNEIIEFAATKLVEKTNVGDYDNNAWDLVFNLSGAVVAVVVIRVVTGRRRVREVRSVG